MHIEIITNKHNQDLQVDNHAQEHKMYPGKPSLGRKPNNLSLPQSIHTYHVMASLSMPLAKRRG